MTPPAPTTPHPSIVHNRRYPIAPPPPPPGHRPARRPRRASSSRQHWPRPSRGSCRTPLPLVVATADTTMGCSVAGPGRAARRPGPARHTPRGGSPVATHAHTPPPQTWVFHRKVRVNVVTAGGDCGCVVLVGAARGCAIIPSVRIDLVGVWVRDLWITCGQVGVSESRCVGRIASWRGWGRGARRRCGGG